MRWVEALLERSVEFVVDLVWRDGGPSSARDAQPLQSRAHGGPAAVERDAEGVLSGEPEHLLWLRKKRRGWAQKGRSAPKLPSCLGDVVAERLRHAVEHVESHALAGVVAESLSHRWVSLGFL